MFNITRDELKAMAQSVIDEQLNTILSGLQDKLGQLEIEALQILEKNNIAVDFNNSRRHEVPQARTIPQENSQPAPQDDCEEINFLFQVPVPKPQLPLPGTAHRRIINDGEVVYAYSAKNLDWRQKTIIASRILNGSKVFRLNDEAYSWACGTKMAYLDPPDVLLMPGTRVVAKYQDLLSSTLLPGVVAEPPKSKNKHRYLVFFDKGFVQYISHRKIYLMCQATGDVTEDIKIPSVISFIKNYLHKYPEIPMLRLNPGQHIKTEANGSWHDALVASLDASLVKVHFVSDDRDEWIHRGSPRFNTIYKEMGSNDSHHRPKTIRRRKNVHSDNTAHSDNSSQPYIEYPREEPKAAAEPKDQKEPSKGDVESRTSTRKKKPNSQYVDDNYGSREIVLNSEIAYLDIYVPHICSPDCLKGMENLESVKGSSYLRIPMTFGWERLLLLVECFTVKKMINYRGPCHLLLHNMEEVLKYITLTKSSLEIDMFTFDVKVDVYAQFNFHKAKREMEDFTRGLEPVPVSAINNVNDEDFEDFEYSSVPKPMEGVHVDLDPQFLCGCDCTDNCLDSSKCQCQILTRDSIGPKPRKSKHAPGYRYRRLESQLKTGVYECNSNCKCKSDCLNRLVQNGMKIRLQLFKTKSKGWGVRNLDDLAIGTFICTYAGEILTDTVADGALGDEYYTDLDFIEIAQSMKEGYESNPEHTDEEDESKKKEIDPNKPPKQKSLRRYFNNEKFCYIMDAKRCGNIGRYLNHSCGPNTIVQNVFIDTHDPRFACIAFFTNQFIPAGTELTWNYSYVVGSVAERVMYCYCGSSKCRNRLL